MPVSFVAGTNLVQDQWSPITAAAPSGLANGDTLLAFLFVRSTPTPPSGWTLVASTSAFDQDGAGLNAQTLHVYTKNSVTTGDSGADFDWTQSDEDLRIGVAYGAFRTAGTITSSTTQASNGTTYVITPPTKTATDNGQMLVCIGSTIFSTLTAVSPTFPSSFTLITDASLAQYRLAAAYRAVNSGQSNSGDIDMAPGASAPSSNGLGAITLLIASSGVEALPGWLAVDSPLSTGAIAAKDDIVGGRLSIDTILGSPSILGLFDLSPYVAVSSPSRFVMDLVTPTATLRIPISSWQATLQTGAKQYLNCVVPSPEDYIDDLADATEFRILGVILLTTGNTSEYALATAPLESVNYAQGGTNYSATLSGYAEAAPDVTWPTTTDRTLTGIRTIFSSASGRRVRCAVDWSLRPGQRAVLNGTPFVVSFINYSVSDSDQFMDVGELVA